MRDEVPSKPDVPKANGWNNDGWDEEFDVPEKPKPKKKLSPRGSIKKKNTVIKANKVTADIDTSMDGGVGDQTEEKTDLQGISPVNTDSDKGDKPVNDTKEATINVPDKSPQSTQSLSNEDILPEPDKTGLPDTHKVQPETNQVQSITKPDAEFSSTNLKPDQQSKTKSPKVKKSKKLVEKAQLKSGQSDAPPDSSPEVHTIDPAAMKESEIAISKLVEHSESLGNSFEILTNRLQSREEQLVKLSTSNADLLAQNDDLKSQLDFLNEKDQINSKELKNMKNLEKEHQVNYIKSYHLGFRWAIQMQLKMFFRNFKMSFTKPKFN